MAFSLEKFGSSAGAAIGALKNPVFGLCSAAL
jgi:hypothetical protein